MQQLFGVIITKPEVAKEFGKPLPYWVEIKQPHNLHSQLQIHSSLDEGEASAIALALELNNCLLIIDDLKGRKYARQAGLTIIGTIGIIVEAKLAGIITSVKPILAKIKGANFRITKQLEALIIKKAGE